MGFPQDVTTDMGPLISRSQQQMLLGIVAGAQNSGAKLLLGGDIPEHNEHGCWLNPTILVDSEKRNQLIRQELFGPVVTLVASRNFKEAVSLCNDTQYGLLAGIYTQDTGKQQLFCDQVQAGIILINQARPVFNPEAPFTGWKDSAIGLPEHGRWDKDFYTRTQAIYPVS